MEDLDRILFEKKKCLLLRDPMHCSEGHMKNMGTYRKQDDSKRQRCGHFTVGGERLLMRTQKKEHLYEDLAGLEQSGHGGLHQHSA